MTKIYYNTSSNAYKIKQNNPVRIPRHKEQQKYQYSYKNNSIKLILCLIFLITFSYGLYQYISLSNKKQINQEKIYSLELELTKLKNKNETKTRNIESSIDYSEIYRMATEELGMVYPDSKNIIKYKNGESEYVIQFKDVN